MAQAVLHTAKVQAMLDEPLTSWLKDSTDNPIVISSRVRLARNFKGIPFTNRNDETALTKVDTMADGLLTPLRIAYGTEFSKIDLMHLSPQERAVLVEKHLMSPNLAKAASHRSLLVSDDSRVAVMVNEEDHLRIQAMTAGLNLHKAYEVANNIDDAIESKYDYAFHEQYGYITACPTNVGTGMRASVMLHLAGLSMTKRLDNLVNSLSQLGFSVRGLYGEGSEALGHMYQVSNQKTLGVSENDSIEALTRVVKNLVHEEEKAREDLLSKRKLDLEDRLWRAYGTLQYARRLSGEEALSLLSDVKLGQDLQLLPVSDLHMFNQLVVTTRPNFLMKMMGKSDASPDERDAYRATVIRDALRS